MSRISLAIGFCLVLGLNAHAGTSKYRSSKKIILEPKELQRIIGLEEAAADVATGKTPATTRVEDLRVFPHRRVVIFRTTKLSEESYDTDKKIKSHKNEKQVIEVLTRRKPGKIIEVVPGYKETPDTLYVDFTGTCTTRDCAFKFTKFHEDGSYSLAGIPASDIPYVGVYSPFRTKNGRIKQVREKYFDNDPETLFNNDEPVTRQGTHCKGVKVETPKKPESSESEEVSAAPAWHKAFSEGCDVYDGRNGTVELLVKKEQIIEVERDRKRYKGVE